MIMTVLKEEIENIEYEEKERAGASNRGLRNADRNQNDEFYTQFSDIQAEINAYLEFNPTLFKDKIVLLPCDDPEWSNFTKFFAQNFERFGLKKLISTSYATNSKKYKTPVQLSLFELEDERYNPEKSDICGKIFMLQRNKDSSGKIDINDLEWDYLDGDGDFRSDEIKKLRDEADFIITNPPFSLFREFVSWLIESKKQFLIIGNVNAISYKEVFPLIKDNLLWPGCRFNSRVNGKNMTFLVPPDYPLTGGETYTDEQGRKLISVAGTGWYTNIEHGRRHQPLPLMSMSDNIKFSKHKDIKGKEYKKFDNYDAINIPFTDAIPNDYDGLMGVPITFLSKYCPEQFEIIDGIGRYSVLNNEETKKEGKYLSMVNGKPQYFRIIIRRK